MTDQNTVANDTSTEGRKAWPQRFGTLTSLQVKQGRAGRFGVISIDCSKFTQSALVFNEMALEKLIAAGEGSKVWVKGPIESITRKNADGATYQEDVFKVVYAKDITPDEGAPEAEDAAAETPAEPQDLTAVKGIGPKVAEALAEAGITTYAALAAATEEMLEAAGKGFAARAGKGDWLAQAAALDETDGASARTDAEIDEEVPF
jgi:predicted flap endonuclease-1-like 5' DNA nuclease